jgi:hypothetical protein
VKKEQSSGYYIWWALGGMVLILGIYLIGTDLYSSYQTTLNYLDPSIKPLYLPSYAGITEPIPSGLDRTDIISIFDSRSLGQTAEDLTSPTSPMVMHGYWE